MTVERLQAVCPLLLGDFDRFRILMRSLDRFCDPEMVETVLVVVRERERDDVRAAIVEESWRHRTEVITEESLGLLSEPSEGWFRQQIIKLAAADRIPTPFYLTLDADVICCKPVSYGDLVPGGRAAITLTSRRVHSDWWHQSAAILGVRPRMRRFAPRLWKPRLTTHRQGMSVTPAVLSTGHVRELMRALERKWKTSVAQVLAARPFTEYTLYFLYLESKGLVDLVHDRGRPVACRGSGANVWFADQFEAWDVERLFGDSQQSGFFTVCQAGKGIATEQVWERVAARLRDPQEGEISPETGWRGS